MNPTVNYGEKLDIHFLCTQKNWQCLIKFHEMKTVNPKNGSKTKIHKLSIFSMPWFLKCGPWTSSMSIRQESVRNASTQASLQTYHQKVCGEALESVL